MSVRSIPADGFRENLENGMVAPYRQPMAFDRRNIANGHWPSGRPEFKSLRLLLTAFGSWIDFACLQILGNSTILLNRGAYSGPDNEGHNVAKIIVPLVLGQRRRKAVDLT